MALAKCCWPLNKVTDGDRWDAENFLGRLGIVVQAAILHAGFLPHGTPAATPWSITRCYSLLQLAARGEGADAAMVRRSGRGRRRATRSYIALQTYITTSNGGRCRREGRTRLDNAAIAAVLSGDADSMARALRTPGSTGCWFWRLLADDLCRGFFLHVCRVNGVPAGSGFASLPSDVKAAILGRLHSARDLARMECASKELRKLVAEHDADLWKRWYESLEGVLDFVFPYRICSNYWNRKWELNMLSLKPGKQRYVAALRRSLIPKLILVFGTRDFRRETPAATAVAGDHRVLLYAAEKGKAAADACHCFAAQCNGYRRRHGAGAIHSPSSRYRWKHR